MKVLLFDLETTGLPYKNTYGKFYNYKNLDKYNSSRVIQIALIYIDTDLNTQLAEECYFIKPDNFIINNQHIHNITQNIAEEKGEDFKSIIDKLSKYYIECDLLVAHNVEFDVNVLLSELHRYGYVELSKIIYKKQKFCTCRSTADITKLYTGRGLKYPKLSELHQSLFGSVPENLHDALIDTKVLTRCFLHMLKNKMIIL